MRSRVRRERIGVRLAVGVFAVGMPRLGLGAQFFVLSFQSSGDFSPLTAVPGWHSLASDRRGGLGPGGSKVLARWSSEPFFRGPEHSAFPYLYLERTHVACDE